MLLKTYLSVMHMWLVITLVIWENTISPFKCVTNNGADWGLIPSTVGNLCVALLANDKDSSWATLLVCFIPGNAVLLGFWVGFLLWIPSEAVGELPFGFPWAFIIFHFKRKEVHPSGWMKVRRNSWSSLEGEESSLKISLQKYYTFLTKAAITALFPRSSRDKWRLSLRVSALEEKLLGNKVSGWVQGRKFCARRYKKAQNVTKKVLDNNALTLL